jgi:hypothetical protein
MILLVSGEGSTDIGATQSAQCPTPTSEVAWGPMGRMIDRIVEPEWRCSPIDMNRMMFIAKTALLTVQKSCKQTRRRSLALPGRERGQETAFFFDNARTLARIAKELATSSNENVGAVLFRDADGTNSGDRSQRDDKVKSMVTGFQTEDFEFGVPMVPKPKSEAWLICALQGHPYQNCERLEEMSGNDDSPRSAKKQLAAALAAHPRGTEDLSDLVDEDEVNVQQIDMPSFNEFRERMTEVARAMRSAPT